VAGLALWCAVALLGGSFLGGCANGSSDPDTRVAAKSEPAKPEQVVQRIEPASEPEPTVLEPTVAEPTVPEQKGNPATPSAGDKRAAAKAGTISAKHLEAELNRLEAELK
jgi:hypothetical protein